LDAEVLSQVHSVEFINSMCVVRKAPPASNGLGHRVIAGLTELVVPGHHKLHALPYQLEPVFDQSCNPWTVRTTPPDEALPHLEDALANARQKIAEFERVVADLRQTLSSQQQETAGLRGSLDKVYSSTSWRITAPLRNVKAKFQR
jgi:hypothetical protein